MAVNLGEKMKIYPQVLKPWLHERQGGYTCDKFWRQIEGRANRILQETWAL